MGFRTTNLIIGCLVMGFAGVATADIEEVWSVLYNGPQGLDDEFVDVLADDAGILVVGDATVFSSPRDMALMRFDTEGQLVWMQAYDGPTGGNDYGAAMDRDADGNIYVAGYGYSSGIPNTRNHFMKCAPDGTLLWGTSFSFSGAYSNISNDVAVDSSGNMYVTGWTIDLGQTSDISVIKIDTNGNIEWSRKYNGPGNYYDGSYGIAVDSTGHVYVSGRVGYSGTPDDVLLVKYDPDGNVVWDEIWSGPAGLGGTATELLITPDDSIIVGGHADVGNNIAGGGPDQDVFIVKYSSKGQQQWLWTYNGPDNLNDHIQSLVRGPSGELYFTGDTDSVATGRDMLTGRITAQGVTEWIQTAYLDGSYDLRDGGEDLVLGADGDVYVVGSGERVVLPIGGGPETEEGTWLVAYEANGTPKSSVFTVRNGSVREMDIAPDGCMYAVGVQWGTNADGLVIKYAEPFVDCNGNGTHDPDDIDGGVSEDCNGNGVPDECDLDDGTSNDCDGDGAPDECQISGDPGLDIDATGILDSCEAVGDLDGSGTTGVEDLLIFLGSWGPCDEACPADFDGDGIVGVLDLLILLGYYGL